VQGLAVSAGLPVISARCGVTESVSSSPREVGGRSWLPLLLHGGQLQSGEDPSPALFQPSWKGGCPGDGCEVQVQLNRSFSPRIFSFLAVAAVKPVELSHWGYSFMTAQAVMTVALPVPEFPP